MVKVKDAFIVTLAIISILGFLSIMLESFGYVNIDDYIKAIILIVIGVGLLIEGNVRVFGKMMRNGLTADETTHILAIMIGFFAIITGIFSLPVVMITNPVFNGIKVIISAFAIIIIIIETWVVK